MPLDILGMNVSDIREVQDILAAFLVLQQQTEKSNEDMLHISNENLQIYQLIEKTHSKIKDLVSSEQEIQKNQEAKLQMVNEFYTSVHKENKVLYETIIQQNNNLREDTKKAISKALASVDFNGMAKEVEISFQKKLAEFQGVNGKLEELIKKTTNRLDLLETRLKEFDKATNKENMFSIFIRWISVSGGIFALGVNHEPVTTFLTELLSSVF